MANKTSNLVTRIKDIKYEKELFDAHLTDSPVDQLFSIKGGIPKATNWMVVGDPGVGKSTVTLDIISNAKKNGSKVLFISAEMNQIDLYLYVERYPKFADIDIFFPQELNGKDPKKALDQLLNDGYDIVLIDSLVELQEIIREECKMTRNRAEKYLLDTMYKHNLANNKSKTYTTFLNIQQVNKGGVFVGSNKLKHMTTGMMEIRFIDETNQEERYVVFSKNRRGHVGKQMFFDLSGTGDVNYDWARFKKSENLRELKKKEKTKLKEEGLKFNQLFGIDPKNDEE
tara:strand:+ start:4861 stop:5715 length:855 start_codon:yes stop_codon:yes gene_type:complete